MKFDWLSANLSLEDDEGFNVTAIIPEELTIEQAEELLNKGYKFTFKKSFIDLMNIDFELVNMGFNVNTDPDIDINYIKKYISALKEYKLYQVYSLKEASDIWEINEGTIRQWCNRRKFTDKEARKSAGTWLITHEGMERVSGKKKI
ncbi:helix-turn-helix domain-containing protein [Bacillus mobilis]|uniref:Helix-turn-helix domain-containing protein n=1 Tax=Bacillus mobilis TaxID=2026190 RepID=A0ABV4S1J0_9BACI